MKDLKNDIGVAVALNPATIATDTTTNGNVIDLQGYESATFVIGIGTRTDGTYTPLLKESDVSTFGGEENAVDDADLIGTEAAAALTASNTVKTLGYKGSKRYLRLSVVSTSTTSGTTSAHAHVIKGDPHIKKDTTN